MNVMSCRRCRKLFNYVVGPYICPACRDEMEKEFQVVKKYIEDNPHSNMKDVSDACEVDTQQIRQWVREERLQFSEDSMVGLNCERCGVMIRSGKYCDKCKAEMTNGFNEAIGRGASAQKQESAPVKRESGARMRFLDN